MGRCCRGSSWRSSGWRRPLRRRESCTFPALRSAPSGCSPGAGSRRTGSRRRQRRRQRRSGSRLSRQRPTWKSNRSKSYWGLPTRKTAWRESWIDMVIGCFSSYLDVCDSSEVTVGDALQKDIHLNKFLSLMLTLEILKRVKMWADSVCVLCTSVKWSRISCLYLNLWPALIQGKSLFREFLEWEKVACIVNKCNKRYHLIVPFPIVFKMFNILLYMKINYIGWIFFHGY